MGVGTPSDILGAVNEGIDMFDCVMPTRSGRTGLAFTWQGKVNLKNSKYQKDNQPLYSKSIGRWKNYENDLIEGKKYLEGWIKKYGY